jgi:predicted RNA polymerase sigma factor
VEDDVDETTIADERLELLFTCCYPALALDAQVALTLRTQCRHVHRTPNRQSYIFATSYRVG